MVGDTFECIRKKLFLSLDGTKRDNKCVVSASLSSKSLRRSSNPASGGKGKPLQSRESEYRIHIRLITTTSERPICYFNDHMELLVAFHHVIKGYRNLFRIASILHRDISVHNIIIGLDGRKFIIYLDYIVHLNSEKEKKKIQLLHGNRNSSTK
ncbi:hypothetical protein RclHR1_05070007 [Rhizophagus clarus]|uniref:Fungal-type protein kinase domain-containing protein n=1 Tax=Rhizophagus clarus TaxID=94130 RepID=A0A2Z6RR02_9GLOM|nr:hypothetical protein RclHR1_05070007 [Rhizophagus clarus]GES88126.1 hypothetical protein RCL_jg25536.t1 [Rhizophagus clarus]